jgi:hypothetical protein
METTRELLRWTHLVAGILALSLFWVPALTTKGGTIHRRAGRAYLWAMWSVLGTGLPLALLFFMRGQWFFGSFLAYLAIITGTGLWAGTAVLGIKAQGAAAFRTPAHAATGVLNLLAALAILAMGLYGPVAEQVRPLFVAFSAIGLFAAWESWRFFRAPPGDRRWWWYEHLGNMIGTGIAAHTAFAAFGARALFPEWELDGWGLLPWLAPTVIGLAAASWANAHYRRRFAASA